MHCVRNVTNFDLRGGYPNSGFLFDDTPVRVGIRAQDLNDADVNVYHTKVGGWGRDELTEDAVYFELIDSKRNTFRHVGNFRDPGNIDQSLITFIRFADTKAIGSGQESHLNTFEGLTLGDTQVADATNERQAFMQRWLNVRGTYAADYNTATHFLAVRPTDAGAGATNGGQPFEMYLPFEQSFRAGQSMRIMGYLHARATAFSDYIGRFVIRVPLGSDGGGTKVTLTELDTVGPVDWTGIGLGSPTFDADSMSVSTTYTSPTSSYSRARLTVEAVSII